MQRTLEIDELLRHAGWLRKLAASLVRDPARADDLVQDTWLAVLRRPPLVGAATRPWLARVFRNVARNRARDERTRAGHESRSSERSAGAGPDAIAAEVEAQRLLAEAIGRLAEPARSIVVLRYFRGLDASAIGRELALPSGTVRWKLSAALEELRRELDRRFEGGRKAWCLLFGRVLAASAPATSFVPWLAASALALVLGAWWMRGLRTHASESAPASSVSEATSEVVSAARLARLKPERVGSAKVRDDARMPAAPLVPPPAPARDEPDLSGRVRVDGRACGAPVVLEVSLGDGTFRSLSTDENGSFEVFSLRTGLDFAVRAPRLRFMTGEGAWLPFTGTTPARGLELELCTPPTIHGRTVNERGEPVPDAHGAYDLGGTASGWMLESGSLPFDCDGEGRFEIPLLALMEEGMPKFGEQESFRAALVFEAPRAGRRVLETGPIPFASLDLGDVVLEPVRGLAFVVRDEHGGPLSGAVARMDDHWLAQPSNPTNAEGRGELRYAPERDVRVRFSALGYADRVLVVAPREVPEVWLDPLAVLEVQLEPPAGSYEAFPELKLIAQGALFEPMDITRLPLSLEIDAIQVELGASRCNGHGSTGNERGRVDHARFLPDAGGHFWLGLRPDVPFTIEVDLPGRAPAPQELILAPGEHKRVVLAYE